jgi:p-cumate 2,3-dioxygenase beta subunit
MTNATAKTGASDWERVSCFLAEEAHLLDDWRLDEWLELLTEDVRYVVPSTDLPGADPDTELVLIDDDIDRLRGRVERLKSRRAHREYPWSRTRRLIGSPRVSRDEAGRLKVSASFAVHRIRSGNIDVFVGRYDYVLVEVDGDLRIQSRYATLDMESLSPHGAVSMIL